MTRFACAIVLGLLAALPFASASPVQLDWDGDGVLDVVNVESSGVGSTRELRIVSGLDAHVLCTFKGDDEDLFAWSVSDASVWNAVPGPSLLICSPLARSRTGLGRVVFQHARVGTLFTLRGGPSEVFGVTARVVADANGDELTDLRVGSLRYRDDGVELYVERVYSGSDGSQLSSVPESTYISWVPGDADVNGVVELDDAQITLAAAIGLIAPDQSPEMTVDASLNGTVDSDDLDLLAANIGSQSETDQLGTPLAAILASIRNRITRSGPVVIIRHPCGPGTDDPFCFRITGGSSHDSGDHDGVGGGSGSGGSGGSGGCETCQDADKKSDMEVLDFRDIDPAAPIDSKMKSMNGDACYSGLLTSSDPSVIAVRTESTAAGQVYKLHALKAGRAVVTYTFTHGLCRDIEETADFVVNPDIDIDSDNNNGLDMPEQSAAEEAEEQVWSAFDEDHSGKVVLSSSTIDSDHDGLPDILDGFDGFVPGSGLGGQAREIDDLSGPGQMVPIVIEQLLGTSSTDGCEVKLRFHERARYIGEWDCDPTVPQSWERDGFRIWTKPCSSARMATSITEGGDLVHNNEWIPLAQLPSVLWVEASGSSVHESIDLAYRIKNPYFQVGGNQEEYWESGELPAHEDRVNIMGIEARLYSIESDGTKVPRGGMLAVTPGGATLSGILSGPQQLYQIEVDDARMLTSQAVIRVGAATLPLTLDLDDSNWPQTWSTPKFYVGSRPAGGDPAALVIPATDGVARLAITSFWDWVMSFWKSTPDATAVDKIVAQAVEASINELESEGWKFTRLPNGTIDSGAFGKAVHARAAAKLTGANWLHDVWVKIDDGTIVQFGGASPIGVPSTSVQQVDSIYLKDGITKHVGDVLDEADIIRPYEIKTNVSGSRKAQEQLQRITSACRGHKPMLTQGSRLCSPTGGWGENPNFARLKRALAIAGCAAVGVAAGAVLFNFIQSEEQARDFEARIAPILLDIQAEHDSSQRRIAILMGIKEIRDYFAKYTIEGGALDMVFLGTAYHVLGKEESH